MGRQTLYVGRSRTLKLINALGKTCKTIGLDPFRLNADDMIRKAQQKAGFSQNLPQVEEGLRIMVKSINDEAMMNSFGSMAIKNLLERTLYGRYKIEQVLADDPSIEKTPVENPVFIVGLPRTGTTILHNMLHEDPAHRSPLAWECLLPYPPATPETFHDNPQIRTIRKEFDQLFKLVPDFQKKHHMEALLPQECISIDAFDFNTIQIVAQLYIPTYADWISNHADRLATMRFHKRFLQYLQSGGVKSERWLLKTPMHLMRLPELFAVYPDAKLIITHRDPSVAIVSTASTLSSTRSLYTDHEDPHRTGRDQMEIWSIYFKRFLHNRKSLNRENQILDLKFENFSTNFIQTAQMIYDHFGWDLPATTVDRFKSFLEKYPRNKFGIHEYTAEDFGLSRDLINSKFTEYNEFLSTLN
ncbi:MAG: sulfotransferase [Bacteroidales bacterium]|nr:sulfotransferase [Bacteroidales bacterium]